MSENTTIHCDVCKALMGHRTPHEGTIIHGITVTFMPQQAPEGSRKYEVLPLFEQSTIGDCSHGSKNLPTLPLYDHYCSFECFSHAMSIWLHEVSEACDIQTKGEYGIRTSKREAMEIT